MPVDIRFDLASQHTFQLCCGRQTRPILPEQLATLLTEANAYYFGENYARPRNWNPNLPTLVKVGRSLYQWLDGPEGWLRTNLTRNGDTLWLDLSPVAAVLELNADTDALIRALVHLPWELLHDGKRFLAELGIQPIRLLGSTTEAGGNPANRPLRLLFMASSPENVRPVLAYEQEESRILEATSRQPIELIVEESGSLNQLANLVASFPEDHFDVFHYTGHGAMDGLTPLLVTEDDFGKERRAPTADLSAAFGNRWPRVVFLSACHTAQAPDGGAAPSLSHALILAGAPAVLGWARPVLDTTGILAATHLYRALAIGDALPQAVSAVRRELLREFLKGGDQPACPDWHLLRLYQSSRRSAALVTPLNHPKRAHLKIHKPETEFLDADGKVKVTTAVFGRRREIQRCLQALNYPSDHYGVFLHGLGGYGKSTLAARLCARQESRDRRTERVVLVGPVTAFHLRQKLSDKFGAIRAAIDSLNQPQTELKHQLVAFLEALEQDDHHLTLVFDDFEQNIPEANVNDGSFRITSDAYRVFDAVCFALNETTGRSRLIVTCRYHRPDTLPPNRLYVEGLGRMSDIDVQKKTEAGLQRSSLSADRQSRILKAADGNPRLLEKLFALPAPVVEDDFLEDLGEALAEYREHLLADKLLGTLAAPERRLLARMTIFELPVPTEMLDEFREGVSPACPLNLGLLEKLSVDGEDLYRVSTILAAPLAPMLTPVEWTDARLRAARKLLPLWRDRPGNSREDRGLEIVRLALAAGEHELAVTEACRVATTWIANNRYRDVRGLSRTILNVVRDYRILGAIAEAEMVLGEIDSARSHWEESLVSCPPGDQQEKSTALHNLAMLEAREGNVDRAMELWQQCLDIEDATQDRQGRAATLNAMAGVIAEQDDADRALVLWQESLDIYNALGDSNDLAILQGKAATLHNMAGILAQKGHVDQALALYDQSLEIKKRIGNRQGIAATLHQMAGIHAERRAFDKALPLWQQSLAIFEDIGDVQGKAATLAQMGWAAKKTGNKARAEQLYREAATCLAGIRAYLNLIPVLGNLSTQAEKNRPSYAAQASWIALNTKAPVEDTVGVFQLIFNLLPTGDPLRTLLGAAARLIAIRRGNTHPDREKLVQKATAMLDTAACETGATNSPTPAQLEDPDYVLPPTRALLEAIIGDTWLFDPNPIRARSRIKP